MKPVLIRKRNFISNEEIDKQVLEDHFGFNFFLKPKGFCGRANFYGFNYFSGVDMVNTTPAPDQFDEWCEVIESELFIFKDSIKVSDKIKTEKLSYDFLSGYYSTFEKILDALEIDY